MGKRHLTLTMGAAVLAASVFGAGCSRKSETSGEGAARISAINLAYSDTTSVVVQIESDLSGPNPASIQKPIKVPLGQKVTGNNWSTTAQGIPAGNVKYTGTAYQGTTSIFTGSVLGVITAGQTASVTLNLFQTTPNAFANNAPVIDALQVGTTSATPGQVVSVSIVAHDPDAGDTLTYGWTATCGTFATASSASTTWTAPASTSAPCVLTVTVTDNHGAANAAVATISVQSSNVGGVAITVVPDLAPIIMGINVNVTNTATPPVTSPFVTGSVANLSVIASDDGSIASYAWTQNAACTGGFSNAAISNPAFTVTAAAGTSCVFTVVVTDDKGQSTTGTLTLPVVPAAGSAVAAPVVGIYSQSSDNIALNQTLYLYLVASQIAGDVLDFTWSDNLDGGAGSSATVTGGISSAGATIVSDPTVTQPNIQIKYVAPADLGTPSTPILFTITVTDTVNHLTASHLFTITKANDPCANNAPTTTSCDDGNACTQSDHCDGAGHCVGASPVVCSASDSCHVAGTCNQATGQCSNPNAPNGTTCSDGNACTTNDICNGLGTCSAGAPVVCTATACNTPGTCDSATGQCSAQTPVANGTACSDNNACTQTDTCQAGACVGGNPVVCSTTLACHTAGTCVPATGVCSPAVPVADGTLCDDGNFCTSNDACTNGVCVGPNPTCVAPLVCNAAIPACVGPVCAQPSDKAKDWGTNTKTLFLASDGSGNMYAAGALTASFDFGAGAKAEGGDFDVFVNKVDPATGLALWTQDFGDSAPQTGLGVAASSASIGVIGNYVGSMNAGTALPTNTLPNPVGFVLGLNAGTGAPMWGKKVDLAGGDFAGVSSNPGIGSFFVCGTFGIAGAAAGAAGPVDLVPASTGFGGKDVVVAKIDATTGAVLWAKNFGGTGDEVCTAVTSDDAGANVYILGTYSNDALNFGTGAFPLAAANQARIYVAKFDGATGTTLAASAFGTTGRQVPTSLVADASGNVILGGAFLTSITFGSFTVTSEGNTDAFVAKLNASLVPQWAQRFGGGNQPQSIRSMATDSAGHIFAVGLFSGSINIGTGGAAVASAGATDAFTLKLDAQGNLGCGAAYGDAAGQEADAVTVARFGTGADKAMFAGTYQGAMALGPSLLNTGSSAVTDAYIAPFSPNSF